MLIQSNRKQEVVEAVRGKRLFFTTDVEKAVREAEIIFVSVNTPTKEYGFGKGLAADLTYWEGAARSISKACVAGVGLLNGTTKIIVEKSTVPVHTADAMSCVLKACSPPGVSFQVIHQPPSPLYPSLLLFSIYPSVYLSIDLSIPLSLPPSLPSPSPYIFPSFFHTNTCRPPRSLFTDHALPAQPTNA
jgi:hypothetical protein